MKKFILLYFSVITAVACQKEKSKNMKAENNLNVSVINKEDPICNMKTAGSISDTAKFKGAVYGFCSSDCKNKFTKNPEAYAVK